MPNIEIPDIIKSASDAAQDNLPATMQQTDGALSTVVGFFNNVVLYPVKKANLTFRYKLEAFEDDLKEKIKYIPQENLQVPPTMIAGPTLEALRYTYDETELREMYENLLASAMDNRISSEAHPSFVDTIKQLSPLDAIILRMFATKQQYKCGTINFNLTEDSSKNYANAMPDYFVEEFCLLEDPFLVSTSLINLKRLGIINITEAGLTGENYDSMKSNQYVTSREKIYRQHGAYDFSVKISKHAVILNNYGKQFIKICLPNGGQV